MYLMRFVYDRLLDWKMKEVIVPWKSVEPVRLENLPDTEIC